MAELKRSGQVHKSERVAHPLSDGISIVVLTGLIIFEDITAPIHPGCIAPRFSCKTFLQQD